MRHCYRERLLQSPETTSSLESCPILLCLADFHYFLLPNRLILGILTEWTVCDVVCTQICLVDSPGAASLEYYTGSGTVNDAATLLVFR